MSDQIKTISYGPGSPVSLSPKRSDCYIGRKQCGCLVAVVVDDPMFKKDTAKTVAEFIKRGYRVESAVWEDVRHEFKHCKCEHDQTGSLL